MKHTAKVLASTSKMPRDEWLDWRRKGIGGSDAAAICGLSPWESPIGIWLQKLGKAPPKEENESMRQGRDLEEYVAQRFTEASGKKVRRLNSILAHPDRLWMLANIDREVVGEDAGFEAKTTSGYNESAWTDGKIPIQYQLQCHHYMAVTGAKRWYIGCLILTRGFVWNVIERDESVIENLISMESEFWHRYVLTGEMPPPDGTEESEEVIAELFPGNIVENNSEILLDGDDWQSIMNRWYELNEIGDRIEKEQDEIKQRLMLAMGKTAQATIPGIGRISWKGYSRESLDTKAFKKEHPEMVERYLKQTPYRRFSIPERN